MKRPGSKGAGSAGPAAPRKELFRAEDLTLRWREMRKAVSCCPLQGLQAV